MSVCCSDSAKIGRIQGGKAVKGLPVKGLKVSGFAHLQKGRRRPVCANDLPAGSQSLVKAKRLSTFDLRLSTSSEQ